MRPVSIHYSIPLHGFHDEPRIFAPAPVPDALRDQTSGFRARFESFLDSFHRPRPPSCGTRFAFRFASGPGTGCRVAAEGAILRRPRTGAKKKRLPQGDGISLQDNLTTVQIYAGMQGSQAVSKKHLRDADDRIGEPRDPEPQQHDVERDVPAGCENAVAQV